MEFERRQNMSTPKAIDEKDIDKLLACLTDRQIARLYNQDERDIAKLRQERQTVRSDDASRKPAVVSRKIIKKSGD